MPRVLVVFIGETNRSKIGFSHATATASELSKRLNVLVVNLQRGMTFEQPGNSSILQSIYPVEDVAKVAGAMDRLRGMHPGKKILLIAHSDSAAMAAQLPGRFPGSADAYLLAGCLCNHAPLRSMPPDTRIALLVGTNDDKTPANFSETYLAALRVQGVKTRLTYAVGATHVSVVRSPEFFMLAEKMVEALAP